MKSVTHYMLKKWKKIDVMKGINEKELHNKENTGQS